MSTEKDIRQIIKKGISNELDYHRAMIADRKLRVLSKENISLKKLRSNLRDLIEEYEIREWEASKSISTKKLAASEYAELIAEKEHEFISARKNLIRAKLSDFGIKQQDLGMILGHSSKSYMSELMNGISSFTLQDLILINRLLHIEMDKLIPPFLPPQKRQTALMRIEKLNNPKLKLNDSFDLVAE